MAEQKKTIKLLGNDIAVSDVPITKALVEHFSEYELEDGSVIRVKSTPNSVLRVEGQYNLDGSPLYIVLTTPVVNVLRSVLSSSSNDSEAKVVN